MGNGHDEKFGIINTSLKKGSEKIGVFFISSICDIPSTDYPELERSTRDKAAVMSTIWHKNDNSDKGHFFSFSREEKSAILYLRNFEKFESVNLINELFRLEYLAGKNIRNTNWKNDRFWLHVADRSRTASALCLITSLTAKDGIRPSLCRDSVPRYDWRDYLRETEDFDFMSSPVRDVTKKILSEFSSNEIKNLYTKASKAYAWVHENISYSLLPRATVENIKRVIASFPEDKRDPYAILKLSFPLLPANKIKEASEGIKFPSDRKDPLEQARYLTGKLMPFRHLFFYTWEGRKTRSAGKTIIDGMGKCDCISNVFVALCRSMGIPAMTVIGYMKDEGRHAWAAIYIPPYGWLEVDPTNQRFMSQFDNDEYLYEFLRKEFKGEKYLLPLKTPADESKLNACKKFYEYSQDHPFSSRLLLELER